MDILEVLKTLFLGVVEGITEWLPVSSTGHMILVDEFLQLNQSAAFKEMFFVVIQLAAILAVILMYWNKLFPFDLKNKTIKMDKMTLWFKILVATIPAAVIGIFLDDWMEEKFYNFQTVSIMLIVYGILFILIENWNKGRVPKTKRLSDISYQSALIIGVFQVLALIPGTSRSGATILGGLLIGMSRYVAAEFTFFLAIPAMVGASLLKVLKFGLDFTLTEVIVLAIGSVTSFIVSVLAIKFLVGYIKKHDFKVFGYYRIVLGIILIAYMLLG